MALLSLVVSLLTLLVTTVTCTHLLVSVQIISIVWH
jgi:hypothetical protein